MDELNAILQRLRREHPHKSEPEYKCPKCKDSKFLCRIIDGREVYRMCDCYVIRRGREVMERSGISAEFQKKTFSNFDPKGNEQLVSAKGRAMRYADDFEKIEHDRRNSIMLSGQVGAGKTHLGTAICGDLINRSVEVSYMAYRNAVTKIKQNIINEEGYGRELSRYATARVLYIDDMLKGRLTEADVNIMYEIINYRYMNNMPIIISTEKSPNELLVFDEAIGSRIIEMCRGNIVQLQGKELNYRLS